MTNYGVCELESYALSGTAPQSESVTDAHRFEGQTLAQRDAGMDHQLTVYHGVHWSTATGQATRCGEIDFVIVHDNDRMLVAEHWKFSSPKPVRFPRDFWRRAPRRL